jgi:hypothetical protein
MMEMESRRCVCGCGNHFLVTKSSKNVFASQDCAYYASISSDEKKVSLAEIFHEWLRSVKKNKRVRGRYRDVAFVPDFDGVWGDY